MPVFIRSAGDHETPAETTRRPCLPEGPGSSWTGRTDELNQLKKNFDITIIISNYLINNEVDKKLKNISHKLKVENFFIIPFYKKNLERNIGTILSSHIFMVQLKKKILVRAILLSKEQRTYQINPNMLISL